MKFIKILLIFGYIRDNYDSGWSRFEKEKEPKNSCVKLGVLIVYGQQNNSNKKKIYVMHSEYKVTCHIGKFVAYQKESITKFFF